MARKSVIKLSQINHFFEADLKLISKGENAMESGHVHSLAYVAKDKIIQGCVLPSMKDTPYLVEITLKDNGDVERGVCKCPRGKAKCHHMAALLLYAHHNLSVTDKECSWSNKQSKRKSEIKTVSELYPARPYKVLKESNNNFKKELFERLNENNVTVGFTWLLSPEPSNERNICVPSMEDIFASREFQENENKGNFLKQHCTLTVDQIKSVSSETIGQSLNWKWSKLRKFRLTASNFGMIIKAMKRKKIPDSLFKTLTGKYNLDGVKAVQWGRQMESTACAAFEHASKLTTSDTGLWIHSSGLLGASPDKLVTFEDGTTGTVEIKCPFKYRNNLLSEVLEKEKNYIVTKNGENYTINKSHNYYHQIQGQLYITNCTKGYLVLWSLKETLLFLMERDDEWRENINVLKQFYFEHFLNYIL